MVMPRVGEIGFAISLTLLLLAQPALAQHPTLTRQFSVGSAPGQAGRAPAGEDTETDGPQAIYAGKSGEIFLLDQVNGRVLSFDGRDRASPTRSLTLPEGIEPTDMIATDAGLVVWDGRPIALDAHGDGLTRSLTVSRDSSAAGDETTLSMFGQMGSQDPGSADDARAGATRSIGLGHSDDVASGPVRKAINTRGAGPVSVVTSRDDARTSFEIAIVSKTSDAKLGIVRLKARDKLGAVELLEIDTLGRMYVLVEVVPDWHTGSAITFVARFAQNSNFEGLYQLPLAPDVALARRFVTVSADGDVYFLRTRNAVVEVLGIGFKALPKNTVIETRRANAPPPAARVPAAAAAEGRAAIAAAGPLNRQQVVETAFGFEGINWRVTAASYGPDPDQDCNGFNRIRRPGYLIGKLN